MGDRNAVVEVVLKAKDLTARTLGRFRRRFQAVQRTMRDVTRTVTAYTVAVGAAIFATQKLGQQGDKVIAVKRAFARITGDETKALNELRAAAQGTIDDFSLMALANQAQLVGAAKSNEEFAEMIRLSRALGRAQGLDATKSLEVFTLALARQSAQRADDLGLQLKGIEASKFAAEFMRQAREEVDELGGSYETTTSWSDRFSAALVNNRNRLAEFIALSPDAAAFFDGLADLTTGIVDAIESQDWELVGDIFRTLGRMFGDALAIGVNEGLEAFIDKGNPFGRWVASLFGSNADAARGNLEANLSALGSQIAAARSGAAAARLRRGPSAERPPTAGVAVPTSGFGDGSRFLTPQFLSTTRERARFLAAGPADVPGINQPDVKLLHGDKTPRDAAEDLSEAGQIAASAMFSTAEAIVAGSEQIEQSMVRMVTNILANLPGVGGFAGAIIGGVGGLIGAALGRRDPVPVRMTDIDDRAAAKLKEKGGDPTVINVTYETGAGDVGDLHRQLWERMQRDEIVRPLSSTR